MESFIDIQGIGRVVVDAVSYVTIDNVSYDQKRDSPDTVVRCRGYKSNRRDRDGADLIAYRIISASSPAVLKRSYVIIGVPGTGQVIWGVDKNPVVRDVDDRDEIVLWGVLRKKEDKWDRLLSAAIFRLADDFVEAREPENPFGSVSKQVLASIEKTLADTLMESMTAEEKRGIPNIILPDESAVAQFRRQIRKRPVVTRKLEPERELPPRRVSSFGSVGKRKLDLGGADGTR